MTPSAVRLHFSHTADPASIPRARHEVEDALAALLDGRALGDVMLLVSELVTNAVRHARTESLDLHVDVSAERLRLEVHDRGAGFEPRIAPREDGTGGYGLYIVDRLADRWGVEPGPGGRIWLEIDRRDYGGSNANRPSTPATSNARLT